MEFPFFKPHYRIQTTFTYKFHSQLKWLWLFLFVPLLRGFDLGKQQALDQTSSRMTHLATSLKKKKKDFPCWIPLENTLWEIRAHSDPTINIHTKNHVWLDTPKIMVLLKDTRLLLMQTHNYTCTLAPIHYHSGCPSRLQTDRRASWQSEWDQGGAYGPLAKVRLGHSLSAGCCLINLL